MGTPRARASIATCDEGLPRSSATPPRTDQSSDRKREGVRSSSTRTAPGSSGAGRSSMPPRAGGRASRRPRGRRRGRGSTRPRRPRRTGSGVAARRARPCIAGSPSSICATRLVGQRGVVEQRELELQDLGAHGIGAGDQRFQLAAGALQGRVQPRKLGGRIDVLAQHDVARRRASASCARSDSITRGSRTSGPIARPGDAGRPRRTRSAMGLVEVALDQSAQLGERRLGRLAVAPPARPWCRCGT